MPGGSQHCPQSVPVNYVRRTRERRLARLEEEERLLNLTRGECSTHPKSTDRVRSVEEKEEILASVHYVSIHTIRAFKSF